MGCSSSKEGQADAEPESASRCAFATLCRARALTPARSGDAQHAKFHTRYRIGAKLGQGGERARCHAC